MVHCVITKMQGQEVRDMKTLLLDQPPFNRPLDLTRVVHSISVMCPVFWCVKVAYVTSILQKRRCVDHLTSAYMIEVSFMVLILT